MENNTYYWDITAKYLQGKANLNEQKELQAWRESDAEHEVQFKAQEKLWRLTEYTENHEVNTERAWHQTKSKIEAKLEQQKPIRKMNFSWLKVAASIAIVFSSIWLFKNVTSEDEMLVVKSGNRKIEIVLPDSSHVWLNKESQLAYHRDFSGPERNVHLEGEAFFEVKKDSKRPFTIKTGSVRTTVLGTSFNLRNYSAESEVFLEVATGRVSFKADSDPNEAIVTPGNGASIRKADKQLSKYSISNGNAWAWRTGKLKFDNMALKNVLSDLERFYGIAVTLENINLGTCRFSGNFENSKLEEVLQVLQVTLDLSYKTPAKNTYIISGQGCSKEN
ncbi:MAG TPA: FecR domain-containing protein [Pedobacter sp.]|jgi:ferric-dicitrate binding protein FerR (iron transport regulator)